MNEVSHPTSKERFPETYQEKFRAWAKGRPLIQTNHAITLEQAADHLDEITTSLLAKNAEIERLTRERNRQEEVTASRLEELHGIARERDRLKMERDDWHKVADDRAAEIVRLTGMLSGEPEQPDETSGEPEPVAFVGYVNEQPDIIYPGTTRLEGRRYW